MALPGRRQRLIDIIESNSYPITPILPAYPPRIQEIGTIRHVVFDVYGTLLTSGIGEIGVDTEGRSSRDRAFAFIVEKYAFPGITVSTVKEHFFSAIDSALDSMRSTRIPQPDVDIRTIWSDVATRCFSSPLSKEEAEIVSLEYEISGNPVWPMPGAKEILESLSSRFSIGIVSNAQFYTPLIMSTFFGDTFFRSVSAALWSYEIGIAKPSVSIFQEYQDRFAPNTDPSEILYVGNDMRNDIHTPRSIGWRTALFAGDQRSLRLRTHAKDEALSVPDVVITDLIQLEDVLSKTL